MEPVGVALDARDSLAASVAELVRSRHGQLPVIDESGRYLGVVTAGAAADVLADGEHDSVAVAQAVEQVASVHATTNLDDALTVLDSAIAAAVPVLAGTGGERRLLGWLSHQQILRALTRPASASDAPADDVAAGRSAAAGPAPGEAGSSHA